MSQRCRSRGGSRRITFRLDRATGAQSLFVARLVVARLVVARLVVARLVVARLVVVVIEMFFSMRRWPSTNQNLAARTCGD